ncbi:MAG TPA: hypothetical protein VH143_32765 [Kofleriaceae bacterium]|nr:hypothetical protein [Kofleriaceae bacterium]
MEDQRACAVCGVVTVHYNGACEQCMARRDQSARGPAVAPTKRRGITFSVGTIVVLAIFVAVLGECHVVHGGDVGIKFCAKDGWSLDDTFVDLDDYIGRPLISQMEHAKVLRAMFRCEALERPKFLDRE